MKCRVEWSSVRLQFSDDVPLQCRYEIRCLLRQAAVAIVTAATPSKSVIAMGNPRTSGLPPTSASVRDGSVWEDEGDGAACACSFSTMTTYPVPTGWDVSAGPMSESPVDVAAWVTGSMARCGGSGDRNRWASERVPSPAALGALAATSEKPA